MTLDQHSRENVLYGSYWLVMAGLVYLMVTSL